ncbi:hypothetical protein ONS95_013686 [Cadophora gregata]|uniref:uncharacterized protein n=1 Tax=Cadophora gregata TaxID=51156 RepID=UPI0026DB2BD6|nr:uncharacterized protein ONS95_013686 [Cadophora gregata]KAK0113428.1 hypothetical protein ONS96_014294 [Cadophora gregata f. sp. sojae]KAK0114186.1 hypothetical protein ONS95_013686 [Cadophora gregata]
MSQQIDATFQAKDCESPIQSINNPQNVNPLQITRPIEKMTKFSILVKICVFFFALHGIQISIALGRSTLRTYYNNQHLESILRAWEITDKAERIQLFTNYYAEQTELKAFQTPHAIDFVFQHMHSPGDDFVEQWMFDEALNIADQEDKERKSGLAYGGPWWEVPFGLHYRHRFNLTSLEKFGVEELRDLVWDMYQSEFEMEKRRKRSEEINEDL